MALTPVYPCFGIVLSMGNGVIFDEPWPADLDPADVPFKQRTRTVLKRQGLFDNPAPLCDLTEETVLSWWNAGPVTVDDLRTTGPAAIKRHHTETGARTRLNSVLERAAREPWARRIWHLDPRFSDLLPKRAGTVHDIATTGSAADRQELHDRLDRLRTAVVEQRSLGLLDAVARHVSCLSRQEENRLIVLLARTGFDGGNRITGKEAANRLGVTTARVYQIEQQLWHHRSRTRPSDGFWMPQVAAAEAGGWPVQCTEAGIEAIREFYS